MESRMKKYIRKIIYDQLTVQYLIDLSDIVDELGWKEGDVIEWIDNKDGTFTLRKKEEEKKED